MFLLDPEEYLPLESMNICTAALDATDLMSASGEIDYYRTYIDRIPVHHITYLYQRNYLQNYITTTGYLLCVSYHREVMHGLRLLRQLLYQLPVQPVVVLIVQLHYLKSPT